MTPAQLIARLVGLFVLVLAGWWLYHQVAVVLPETKAALTAQKALTTKAEGERDAAQKQTKTLQADQAAVAEKEAENEELRRRIADTDSVIRSLRGLCQQPARRVPAAGPSPDRSRELVEGGSEADDPSDGDALADLAGELREVPSDDANHEALAAQWCKLKKQRGETQPGCPQFH